MRLATVLLLATLVACSSSTPAADTSDGTSMVAPPRGWTPPEDPSAASDPVAPAAPAPPTAADRAGVWASPSCGARTFERILELRPDGTFTASDRVSPCPPGARCVWSGIVVREGTWASTDGRVALTVTRDGKGPAGQPLPASLVDEGASLAEEDGGERCPYTRR